MSRLILALLICLVVGCADEKTTVSNASNDQPLAVEAWKLLEVHEKYEPGTFERLKKNDPSLLDEDKWDAFMRDVIVPERKKDIPTNY